MAVKEIRDDLFCPECAGQGMQLLGYKAESGRSRYRCLNTSCGFRTTTTLYTKPQILPGFKKESIKAKKRFIITSAVNDVPIIKAAHNVFKNMAKVLDAAYLVIPGVYKNPDLFHQGVISNYTWPKEILPFVCDADINISKNLVVRGKTRIRYTAVNPLQGLNHAGDMQSEIFGHPQISMQVVPTPKQLIPKILHTTGSISQKYYGGSVTAKKAEFHHSIGALFVETDGDEFWFTQLRFDGQGVTLYDKHYTAKTVSPAKPVAGIVYGDIHTRYLTKQVKQCMDEMQAKLKPKTQVFHDVHDHHIGSHHTTGNKLFALGQNKKKEFSIRDELDMSVTFLDSMQNAVIVDSNHDRHLDQWFNRFKSAQDPVNIDLYYELGEMARTSDGSKGLFELYVQKYAKTKNKFIGPDDMYLIMDIDVTQHGDRGPNGARGSAKAFAKTGMKTIIGHGHTPCIEKGSYQCGVSSFDMPYAKGYSSWLNTHCIIYANGKRGLITLINNKLPPLMRG